MDLFHPLSIGSHSLSYTAYMPWPPITIRTGAARRRRRRMDVGLVDQRRYPRGSHGANPIRLISVSGNHERKRRRTKFRARSQFSAHGRVLCWLAAMERWNLHKRVGLAIIDWMGVTPSRIILGFMVGTAFLSMWISNTATSLMMLPVAIAVLTKIRDVAGDEIGDRIAPALMLSIAYAASIGGTGTLVWNASQRRFRFANHRIVRKADRIL